MTEKPKRKHNPAWADNTTKERSAKRRQALDERAQAIGFDSWRKFETALLNDEATIARQSPPAWGRPAAGEPAKEWGMKPGDKFKGPRRLDKVLRRYWQLTKIIETDAGKRYLFDIVDSRSGKTTGHASRATVSDLKPLD